MEQQEHSPEHVSWVQPEESLAFSVSPVASSGSNDARKSFSVRSRDRDDPGDDEDPSLMGEHIWADGSDEGGTDSFTDERNPSTGAGAAPAAINIEAPAAGEELRLYLPADENRGLSYTSDRDGSCTPHVDSGAITNGNFEEDDHPRGFTHVPLDTQKQPWSHQQQEEVEMNSHPQQQQQQQQFCDNRAVEGSERPHEPHPSGGEGEEDTIEHSSFAGHEDQSMNEEGSHRVAGVVPEYAWEYDNQGQNEEEWVDDDGADFAPACDQGRAVDSHRGTESMGYGNMGQLSRMDSSVDENNRHPPHMRESQRLREAELQPNFHGGESVDSDMDARSCGGSASSSSSRNRDEQGVVDNDDYRREELPSSRVIRRRTRLSLNRERRRLDRLPRSQRLSQVKGHPLGGMTLLQLEERHLLDVGIGQMTRQLAKRRGRVGGGGYREAQQSNEDLLRRSARLLRRAQEERDARFSFENTHGFYHRRQRSSCGSTRFEGDFNDCGARSRSSGDRAKKKDRRPASASRGCSRSRRSVSSYVSPGDTGGTINRAYATSEYDRPRYSDAWECALEGETPPVGLYSGGGTRCSLKQRRPMSAKPALTCGSGWEPGRVKTRSRGNGRGNGSGGSGRWDRFEDDDNPNGAPRRGLGGCGGEEESKDLDVWDLSPQGIVEYTDEEEGPFNVDELERVAASYLLRPRGSACLSSAALDDDLDDVQRFADDGSVYIYREEDGSPRENDRNGGGQCDNGRDGFDCNPRESVTSSDRDNDRVRHESGGKGWHDDHSDDPPCALVREGNQTSSNCHWGGSGGKAYRGMSALPSDDVSVSVQSGKFYSSVGGEVNAGARAIAKGNSERNAIRQVWDQEHHQHQHQQQRCSSAGSTDDDVHVNGTQIESGRSPKHMQTRALRTHESPAVKQQGKRYHGDPGQGVAETLNDLNSRLGCNFRGEPPAEAFVIPVPGASYSAKIDRGLQGLGADSATWWGSREDDVDGFTDCSVKVRQTADRLRKMILDRQTSANRSIREVFGHFDRRRCGYVNVAEMREALDDLRLDLSPKEAQELHSLITLDGGDRLSYAEFAVFVTDPHHPELQAKVCKQAAEQLEGLGRRSFNLDAAFYHLAAPASVPASATTVATVPQVQHVLQGQGHTARASPDGTAIFRQGVTSSAVEMETATGVQATAEGLHWDCVGETLSLSAEEFLAVLRRLGLRLSVSDSHRLLLRFDVHGDGHISARRFVSMIESSRPWTRALVRLAHQEEADEEADACLRAQRVCGKWPPAVEQRRGQVQGQVQGQDQALILNADIVEMARYIGIRVSTDSSLLWIAADALAAPLPTGWVMHKGKEGQWFYHNEITGQSRWDHPLDPHFRRTYLRERLRTNFQDNKEVALGHEKLSEASPKRNGVTPGHCVGSRESAKGGAFHSGGTGGRCPQVQGGRPPVMLPPRRMRPSVLDFPADKALEILRARRLNASSSNDSNSTLGAASTSVAVKRPANGTQNKAHLSITPSRLSYHYHTNGELWADGEGKSGNEPPTSPPGPRRRRPVSASAVREGFEERNQGLRSSVVEAARSGNSEERRGGDSDSTSITLHEVTRAFDPHQDQHARSGGRSTTTLRRRRPRSARATLQSSPPAVADIYQHKLQNNGGDRDRKERHGHDMTNRNAHQYRPSSTELLPATQHLTRLAERVTNGGRAVGAGISGDRGQRGDGGGEGGTQHDSRGGDKEIWTVKERGATKERYLPDEQERTWLRRRLDDLRGKLDEAEAFAREEHQQKHRQRQRSASIDCNVDSECVASVEQGRGGAGGCEGQDSCPNQSSQHPRTPGECGRDAATGEIYADSTRPSAGGLKKAGETLLYREAGGFRSSSSAGNINADSSNNTTYDNNSNHLRDQILELSNRMRFIETRLLQPHNRPSSPTREQMEAYHDEDGYKDNGEGDQFSLVQRSRRHNRGSHSHGLPSEQTGPKTVSPSAARTAVTAAAQKFPQGDTAPHGGDVDRGGTNRGSQDDMAYCSPERHHAVSNAVTSAAASVRTATHTDGSSSSGNGDASLVFEGGEVTSHSTQGQGWGDAPVARFASVSTKTVDRNGDLEKARGRTGTRRSGGRRSGKNSNGNPPGIVLI